MKKISTVINEQRGLKFLTSKVSNVPKSNIFIITTFGEVEDIIFNLKIFIFVDIPPQKNL